MEDIFPTEFKRARKSYYLKWISGNGIYLGVETYFPPRAKLRSCQSCSFDQLLSARPGWKPTFHPGLGLEVADLVVLINCCVPE